MVNEQVTTTFDKLYLDEKTADVHFAIPSNSDVSRIPAHKAILATASSVFDAMFFGEMKEEGDIPISNATETEFKEFLQCFYRHELVITFSNIAKVMELADQYLMTDFLNECGRLLTQRLPIKEVCSAYQIAISFNRTLSPALREFCEKQIRKNSREVFRSDAFLACSKEVLENILKIGRFSCRAMPVFKACIDWATKANEISGTDATTENLRKKLSNCLYLIPFDMMKPTEIEQCIVKYEGLFSEEELQEIIAMATSNSTNLKIFKRNNVSKRKKLVLECGRIRSKSDFESYLFTRDLFSTEVVVFRVSKSMLLHAIRIDTQPAPFVTRHALLGKLQIMENANQILETVEFRHTAPSSHIECPTLVVCQPERHYFVKITFYDPSGWVLPDERCKTEVSFDDNHKVIFMGKSGNWNSSLITHLYFQKNDN